MMLWSQLHGMNVFLSTAVELQWPVDDVMHTEAGTCHLGELLHDGAHVPAVLGRCQSLCDVMRVLRPHSDLLQALWQRPLG